MCLASSCRLSLPSGLVHLKLAPVSCCNNHIQYQVCTIASNVALCFLSCIDVAWPQKDSGFSSGFAASVIAKQGQA